MKLRIYGNSIRLRLNQSEVRDLAAGQPVEERTELAPEPLVYRIESFDAGDAIGASLARGELRVVVPRAQARRWADGDDVAMTAEVPSTRGGERVRLLIEKDFRCLHGPAQEQADCYPNPRAEAPADAPLSP